MNSPIQRALFLSLLLLPILSVSAQDSISGKVKIGRWSIGLFTSPAYTYRKLVSDQKDVVSNQWSATTPNQVVDSLNKIEKATIDFTFGIDFSYQITDQIHFLLGFNYSQKGITSNGYAAYDPVWGSVSLLNSNQNVFSSFKFLEIPLNVEYTFCHPTENFNCYAFAGPTFAINSEYHEYSSRTLVDSRFGSQVFPGFVDAYRLLYIGYSLGGGISYKMKPHLVFFFEPVFKYYLFSFNSDKTINDVGKLGLMQPQGFRYFNVYEKPFSIGGNFGFRVLF